MNEQTSEQIPLLIRTMLSSPLCAGTIHTHSMRVLFFVGSCASMCSASIQNSYYKYMIFTLHSLHRTVYNNMRAHTTKPRATFDPISFMYTLFLSPCSILLPFVFLFWKRKKSKKKMIMILLLKATVPFLRDSSDQSDSGHNQMVFVCFYLFGLW